MTYQTCYSGVFVVVEPSTTRYSTNYNAWLQTVTGTDDYIGDFESITEAIKTAERIFPEYYQN